MTLLLHVVRLGTPPLNLDEGRRALEAWTLLHDARVTYEGAPILTNLTSIVFILFSDGVSRRACCWRSQEQRSS